MSDTDRDKRISALQSKVETYHSLYMRAPYGSGAARYYAKQINIIESELDGLYRERDEEWGADDDPILRQQIADGWPS